jgi:hypothetical protein
VLINPLVAFYDINGGKREVLFFYFVPDTTRDLLYVIFPNSFLFPSTLYNSYFFNPPKLTQLDPPLIGTCDAINAVSKAETG